MSSRPHSREESWDSLHHSDASHGASEVDDYADMSMDEASDDRSEGSPSGTPALLTVSDVHRALHPLQSTADRVGKQVEQFAETLDRLSTRRQRKSQKDCRHVLPLVQAYKKIASGAVEHLKIIHAPERQQQLSRKWKRKLRSSGGISTPASPHAEQEERGTKTAVEDLRRWEEEEQTWDLLGLMLEVEYPIPQSDSQRPNSFRGSTRPSRSKEVLRYSSEKAVWDSFLAHDDLAWERHTVVEWLKKCADESGQDIDLVVKELESGADRGSGLWAHSWLYTKEAIKGQKRLRSWPQALEPDAPGIDTSLVNSDRTKALVTQLDPDAITRQGRSLEKQDHYFEQATWLACWEMVRRGKDWDYIREWCQERVEGWRATLIRGDPRNSQSKEDHPGFDVTTGWRSRALWRKTCALAAKTGGIDPYENAVYGVLGGYLPSVLKVSRSWDDYLFAHYNSYLLSQFDRYVKSHFSDRLPTALLQKHGCYDFSVSEGHRTHSGNQIVQKMKTLEATKKEAKRPFKMLQSSLIAKTFDDFVFKQGVRLCQAANTPERSKILPALSATLLEGSITAPIGMKDYDLLRVITHMLLIFQDLGLDIGEGNRRFATESIVVAYVDYLSKAGKQQLLPLYASFLSHDRSTTCLGRQLPFIRDHRERQTVMRLMKQCGIDVPGVLNMQLQMIIRDSPEKGDSKTFPALAILEPNNHDKSRVRPIQSAFVGDSISDDEQDLINGFEWYMLLEGHWQQTMTTGVVLYKHLLRTHGFAAAKELSKAVPFATISLGKTQGLLGKMVDISKEYSDEEDEPAKEDESATTSRANRSSTRSYRTRARPQNRRSSSAVQVSNERELLLHQASAFRDFENLFAALDAMEQWKALADQANTYIDPRENGKRWKAMFQKAYDRVEATIVPLLSGWLQYPRDDKEAVEFGQIRVACLPEVILAYNTVLNFSAHTLSRDLLLRSMDLAATIAAEDSDLASCFTRANRMPELVDSFAVSSKNIIRAEESGGGKGKMKPDGERLDIWTVK